MRVYVIDNECKPIVIYPPTDEDVTLLCGLFSSLNSYSVQTLDSLIMNQNQYVFYYYGGLLFVLESTLHAHNLSLFRDILEEISGAFCEIYGDPTIASRVKTYSTIQGFNTVCARALYETFANRVAEVLEPIAAGQILTIEMIQSANSQHLTCTFCSNSL